MGLQLNSRRPRQRACVHKGAQPRENVLHVVRAQNADACVSVCGHIEGTLWEVSSEERKVADCCKGGAALVRAQHGCERAANLVSFRHCTSAHNSRQICSCRHAKPQYNAARTASYLAIR